MHTDARDKSKSQSRFIVFICVHLWLNDSPRTRPPRHRHRKRRRRFRLILPEGDGLIIGITGPPGAGKSSLVDALTTELRRRGKTVAIIAVDPSSPPPAAPSSATASACSATTPTPASSSAPWPRAARPAASPAPAPLWRVSSAPPASTSSSSKPSASVRMKSTSPMIADVTVVVLVPGMGDDIQAIKAGIMEIADVFVINKADRPGADQTQHEVEACHPRRNRIQDRRHRWHGHHRTRRGP